MSSANGAREADRVARRTNRFDHASRVCQSHSQASGGKPVSGCGNENSRLHVCPEEQFAARFGLRVTGGRKLNVLMVLWRKKCQSETRIQRTSRASVTWQISASKSPKIAITLEMVSTRSV